MTSRVIVRTGGFEVHPDNALRGDLRTYLCRMHQVEYRKKPKRQSGITLWVAEKTVKSKWYIADDDLSRVFIHWSYFEEFKRMHDYQDIDYEYLEPIKGHPCSIKMKPDYSPRDDQSNWIKYMSDGSNGHHRTLPAVPGGGKTVTDLAILSKLGMRAFILIPPYLKDNWLNAIMQFTELELGEFAYISGGKELKKAMQDVIEGTFDLKLMLVSINTFQTYLSSYQYDATFPFEPAQFFEEFKFGSKTVDEAHTFMEFHFRVNLHCNVPNYLNLTGTLYKEDDFLIDMQNRMYPLTGRCPVPEPTNHVALKAYQYYFAGSRPNVIGPQGYSHIMLEGELQRYPKQLDAYYLNIARVVFTDYMLKREEGDRGLVWFAKTELADGFMEFLATNQAVAEFFSKVKIGRFRAGDGNEVFMDLDLIISTTRKSGTGVDIPNLISVTQSVNTSSKNENAQNLGRLRNLKGKPTTFSYLYCPQFPKHVEYHNKRLEELSPWVHSKVVTPLQMYIPIPDNMDLEHAMKLDASRKNQKKQNRFKQHMRVEKANKRKLKRKYFR